MKKTTKTIDLTKQLQSMLHKHGSEAFMEALVTACFSASNDVSDFDNTSITQAYEYYAYEIGKVMENRPKFLGDKNE